MADREPTKLEQWNANPKAAEWLRATLRSGMGEFLMEVLEERSEMRINAAMPPAFLTANGSAMSGRILGYESCLTNIRKLMTGSAESFKPVAPDYGVKGPEDATE